MLSQLALAGLLAAISVTSAVLALWLLSLGLAGRRTGRRDAGGDLPERAVYLFEDRELLDATGPARALLREARGTGTDWDRLLAVLAPHFTALEDRLAELAEGGEVEIGGNGEPPLSIRAARSNGVTRIEVADPTAEGRGVVVDGLSNRAAEVEISLLRSALAAAPVLVWRTGSDGTVDWANRAYLQRAANHIGASVGDLTWPLPVLFEGPAPVQPESRRQRLVSPDPTRAQWYDVRRVQTPDGAMQFATPIDATVRAETALREFVQTLTKTFAQLPIGLAIFDRQRQLALFNPALVDLTRLCPEVLSARPTLFAFLDILREARMIPEPKDYHSWRQTMTDLERAASSGLYEEAWTLPGGQTYRVTGRPHPDGAVAFLFEDITADISLTRRFRSEIEMGQAVIDKISDAIAVFSQAGTIVLSNVGYAALWGTDPQRTLGAVSVSDAAQSWQRLSRRPGAWDRARDFVTDIAPRSDLVIEAELTDGQRILCRLSRLNGGGTMVRFRRIERPLVTGRKLRLGAPSLAPAAAPGGASGRAEGEAEGEAQEV